ncbi:protein TolR [Psychrobacter sp. 1U2]|uniref:protein TolR n=1 Tax=Psychrobacter sp. 1U2 TaxID=3453577 RepID=UPI003F4486C0
MKPSPYKRQKATLNSEMNVVPYIDVMLVLLVIFMVTAPMLTTGVEVDLPKEQAASMSQNQLPIIVSLTDTGEIFMSYEDNIDVPVSEPELINTLFNLQTQSNNETGQPLQIMINADQNNQYSAIVSLMANLQQAGIEKVGLLTGPPLPMPQ